MYTVCEEVENEAGDEGHEMVVDEGSETMPDKQELDSKASSVSMQIECFFVTMDFRSLPISSLKDS